MPCLRGAPGPKPGAGEVAIVSTCELSGNSSDERGSLKLRPYNDLYMTTGKSTSLLSIPVEQIDSTDSFYSHPTCDASPSECLRRSISACGIGTPLVLEPAGTRRFRIVDGFRRYQVALELGYREIPGTLVSGNPTDHFLLAIALNSAHRNWSELDLAELVVRLEREFGLTRERVTSKVGPLVDRPLQGEVLIRLERLGSLPDRLREAARGRLTSSAALSLAKLPEEDWLFLIEVVENLQLGQNKQREILELFEELVRREEVRAAEIWERSGAGAIAQSSELSPSDRFQGVKRALWRLRFPTLSRHEARFQELTRGMKLPRGVGVHTPPFFEGDRLEIRLRPASQAELREALEKLSSGPVLDRFEEIFEML